MREIYPGGEHTATGGAVDLAAAYAYPSRPTPWVRANMVASVDGAATVEGLSGGLSSAADRELLAVLRGLADVVLVGAQTVRAERYRAARPRDEWRALRHGRPPAPPIAVVSGSLDLDLSSPLITAAPPGARTILLTSEAAPLARREQAAQSADVVVAGARRVDMAAVVDHLAGRGLRRILTEGGPRLLGQLVEAGLLDELCLTVSPQLAGGNAARITAAAGLTSPLRLRLAHVLESEGSLFSRYLTGNGAQSEWR